MADAEQIDVMLQTPPLIENGTADQYYILMQLCENCERYDDMVFYTKKYLEAVKPKYLPPAPPPKKEDEEKEPASDPVHRISVAMKHYVNPLRQRQRLVSQTENDEDAKEFKKDCKALSDVYKTYTLEQLKARCKEVTDTLDSIIAAFKKKGYDDKETAVRVVTIYKMKGDYFRYTSEHNNEDDDKKAAQEAYEKAWEVVNKHALSTTHPTRLGLALNNSVFLWEIMKDKDKAKTMAKTAFDKGISKLDDTKQADYQDATLIMQLLRDNLTIWSADDQEEEMQED